MKEKISVIVPIYKVEKYLSVCIESILKQTYKNLEVILVDDGSPDNCPLICDNYAKKDNRIKVIHKKNGGLSDARNVGLDNATGNYIYFVDSDDYINYNCLNILYNALIQYGGDIVACNVLDVKEDCNYQYGISKNYKIEEIDNVNACLRCVKSSDYGIGVVVWNKLYKKDLFRSLRFEKELYHEDEAIIYQLIYPANKLIYVKEYLHYYRLSSSSIMRSNFSIKKFDILKALKIRLHYIEKKNNYLFQFNLEIYLSLLIYYKYLGKRKLHFNRKIILKIDNEIDEVKKQLNNKNFKIFILKNFPNLYAKLVYIKKWRLFNEI